MAPDSPTAPRNDDSAPPTAEALERVQKLSGLARLDLQADEIAATAPHLERILKAFQKLEDNELGPQATNETPSPSVLREDLQRPSLTPDELLANAPERHDDFYAVPKTIGGSS